MQSCSGGQGMSLDAHGVFSITTGSPVDLETNSYPITLVSSKDLYLYRVHVTPVQRPTRASISTVYKALYPDLRERTSNEEWNAMIFDGFDCLIAPTDNLHESVSSENVKLEFVRKISMKEDLAFVAAAIIRRYMTSQNVNCSCIDDSYFKYTEYADVMDLRIVSGFKPRFVQTEENSALLQWELDAIVDRKKTLYDKISNGIDNPRIRSDLENSVRTMTYVTHHTDRQVSVKVASIDWEPSEEKRNAVSLRFRQEFEVFMRPDEIIVELTNGELFPSCALDQMGLTELETKDSMISMKIKEFKNPSAMKTKNNIDSLMHDLKTDSDTVRGLEAMGLAIGDNVQTRGRMMSGLSMRVRDPTNREYIDVNPNNHLIFAINGTMVAVPPQLNSPPLIICDNLFEGNYKRDFLPEFLSLASHMGVSIMAPMETYVKSVDDNALIRETKSMIASRGVPSFILVICRDSNMLGLNVFRSYCAVELGVPVHFVSGDDLFAPRTLDMNMIRSIINTITAKTGGVPYYVSIPMQTTIAMAVTPYQKSIYSVSASFDHTFARYRTDIIELSSMPQFVEDTVSLFKTMTGFDVTRILLYIDMNSQLEISPEEICQSLRTDLKVTPCCVKREPSLKIFQKVAGMIEESAPGTVAYTGLVNPDLCEFFMMTDSGNSSMPAKYTLMDSQVVDHNHFVMATFRLCCNYPTAPQASCMPAPVMISSANAEYCNRWLKEKRPSQALRNSLLHFI